MTLPDCPQHRDLMLDLARGLLDDTDAATAEDLRESCEHCATWWQATFSEAAIAQVDSAVSEVFAGFSAPARSRRPWLAAAAAAVLVVGLGASTMFWQGGAVAPVDAFRGHSQEAVLAVWDFEDGSVTTSVAAESTRIPEATAGDDEAVFSCDLESGDLDGWTLHS